MQDKEHDLDKRLALMEQAYTQLTKQVENINKNLTHMVWIVGAGVLSAVVQFIIKGGLNV